MMLSKLACQCAVFCFVVLTVPTLAVAKTGKNWSLGLGSQQLRIEKGTGSVIGIPASILWAANIWGQCSWSFDVAHSLRLRTLARLGTSRYYRRFLWFIYGTVAAGPEIALSNTTRAGLLLGYRYDQELRHGSLGSLWAEHFFGLSWGMQVAGTFTRFNVPKDAGVQVSTREFEIGVVRTLD